MNKFNCEIDFNQDQLPAHESTFSVKACFKHGADIHSFIIIEINEDKSITKIIIRTDNFKEMISCNANKKAILQAIPDVKVTPKDIREANFMRKIFPQQDTEGYVVYKNYLQAVTGLKWDIKLEKYSSPKLVLQDTLTRDQAALTELLDNLIDLVYEKYSSIFDTIVSEVRNAADIRLAKTASKNKYATELANADAYDVIINYNPSAQVTEYSKQFRVNKLSDIPLVGYFTGIRSNSGRKGKTSVNYCDFEVTGRPNNMTRQDAVQLLKDALTAAGIEYEDGLGTVKLPLIKVWKAGSSESGVSFTYSITKQDWIPLKDAKNEVKKALDPVKINWAIGRY